LEENPIRIVVDSKARTPIDSDLFIKGSGTRIIVVSKSAPKDAVEKLKEKAVVIVAGDIRVDISEMCQKLKNFGIDNLMVEGGSTLNFSLIKEGVVDEILLFVGNKIIGGDKSPTFAGGEGFTEEEIINLNLEGFEKIDDGILLKWSVNNRI